MTGRSGAAIAPGVWAVVPIKGGAGAKRRLAPALLPAARSELALAMAESVLGALVAAGSIAGVVAVTDDPRAEALATRMGARICAGAVGYTEAVAAGAALLAREGKDAMLCMPADLPLVTTSDIELVVAARRTPRPFLIVPAHDRGGTNAVLCAPSDAGLLRFGDDSFHRHLEAARRAGLDPRVLRVSGIEFDIDVPSDLDELAAMAHRTAGLATKFRLPDRSCPK